MRLSKNSLSETESGLKQILCYKVTYLIFIFFKNGLTLWIFDKKSKKNKSIN